MPLESTTMVDINLLTLHESSFWSLSQELKTPPRQRDNLSFAIFGFLVVAFNALVRNGLNHLNNILRLGYHTHEFFILRLKQLEKSPYGNVLEGRIATGKEASQIAVNATVRLSPILYEY